VCRYVCVCMCVCVCRYVCVYRTQELIENVDEFKKSLPMKRLGEPEEIGNFVKAIIQNNIKYLSGVVINFDGANSNYIF